MKASKVFSVFFGVIGVVLALTVVAMAVLCRDAVPQMVLPSGGAARCADGLFAHVCSGDYAGASGFLYGSPVLDSGSQRDSMTGELIWQAFLDSLDYRLLGNAYATTTGAAQRVSLTSLQIPSVTANLKERAEALLAQRIAQAEDMSQVYATETEYREDFVQSVLRDAVEAAIAQDGEVAQQELTLNLIYTDGSWKVLPDQTLLNALAGGILE